MSPTSSAASGTGESTTDRVASPLATADSSSSGCYCEGPSSAALETHAQDRPRLTRGVILAGGLGSRLHPLTLALPKALMPLGDGTVLDRLLGQLASANITHVDLLLGHQGELIEAYVTARSRSGPVVVARRDTDNLGTAGPLRAVPEDRGTWLVVNGDVVSDIDFASVFESHRAFDADLTMVAVTYEATVPYGVLKYDHSGKLLHLSEKPKVVFPVNSGIYVIGPRARAALPGSGPIDMNDLICLCQKSGLVVQVLRSSQRWFDIGDRDTYEALLRSGPQALESHNRPASEEHGP